MALPGLDVVSVAPDGDPVSACRGGDVCIADPTGRHRVAGDVIDALAPTCRLVQVPASGAETVDLAACAAAGIPVAGVAGLNAAAVAEWCVLGTLAALRRAGADDRSLRAGRWEQLGPARLELAGKLVGIIGMGAVGAATARRFAAFDAEVAYWSRTRRAAEVEQALGVTWLDLDRLVSVADVIVVAIALGHETEGLLDARRIGRMKPSSVVVNAARGGVVDEAALSLALREGRLHGAAVDVFTGEPLQGDHPLLRCKTAVLTPHVAGLTTESLGRIVSGTVENIRRVFAGQEPDGRLI
jgi:D-3-phosphoglycerate dehydrogenase